MLKILYALLVGVVGAALLHLIIILAIPHYSNRDAYSVALSMNAANRFQLIAGNGAVKAMTNDDPFMRHAVCTYDVSEKPLRLTGFGVVPFWSVAVYDDASNEVFSMNERTSVRGQLDVVVGNAAQLALIRKLQPSDLAGSINVEAPRGQGYVVLRSLMPQPSFRPEAERFLSTASCKSFTLPQD
jgi:uncharacterized membrane protein